MSRVNRFEYKDWKGFGSRVKRCREQININGNTVSFCVIIVFIKLFISTLAITLTKANNLEIDVV